MNTYATHDGISPTRHIIQANSGLYDLWPEEYEYLMTDMSVLPICVYTHATSSEKCWQATHTRCTKKVIHAKKLDISGIVLFFRQIDNA